MWRAGAIFAACVLALVVAGSAHAACPPSNSTTIIFCVLTNLGGVFEIEAPNLVPTTDVVSSPYIEFQRMGGLVVSGNSVAEAAQYNRVGTGTTYIVDDWGRGITHGIPNGAPLAGELRMSPVPHLYLKTPQPISPNTYWPAGIGSVEMMAGGITHTIQNHTTYGIYHKFEGTGRAVIWLDRANNFYAINMVCVGCRTNTPAVVGGVADDGHGSPVGTRLGSSIFGASSITCTVDSIVHSGCGLYPISNTPREWPLSPFPDLGASHQPYPDHSGAVLNVTNYDTATCPGADHDNTEQVRLNNSTFQLSAGGCIMQNYDYEWWDGSLEMSKSLPLRAGLNVWFPLGTDHPAIILNMNGGQVLLQAYAANTEVNAESAFYDTLTVDAGSLVGPSDLVILHDSFSHLGAYTRSTLGGMAAHVQTYPQIKPNYSPALLSHNGQPGVGGIGGLLGADCKEGYKYCITVFNNQDLPVITNARGVIYDARNGAELNRGGGVDNHASVFHTSSSYQIGKVGYDPNTLNLIQAYAVIPITGSVSVEELYVVANPHDCSRYVDDTVSPHGWAATPGTAGWLRMIYLEDDYGLDKGAINIPLLPGFGVACMRTEGSVEFRQFVTDNFFVQGASASFGGTRYVSTFLGNPTLHDEPDVSNISVLHTDIVLPGEGVRVMDLDVDLSGSIAIVGVVEGGGGAYNPHNQRQSCNWHLISVDTPPRHTSSQFVELEIDVVIEVPVGGFYQRVDGLSVSESVRLEAPQTPVSVGEDCRHMSYAGFDFEPEYRTIPIEYGSNTPVRVSITTNVDFENSAIVAYAGHRPAETLFVETYIDRLSVRVN